MSHMSTHNNTFSPHQIVGEMGRNINNTTAKNATVSNLSERNEIFTWATVSFLVCICGTLGNGLVLLVTRPGLGAKSSLNLLIFHFVAGNVVMCTVNVPIKCVMVLTRQAGHISAVDTCVYVHALFLTIRQVIFWSDACLAVNRCFALYFPHQYSNVWSKKATTLGLVLLTWILSLVHAIKIGAKWGGSVVLVPELGICSFRAAKTPVGQFLNLLGYGGMIVAGIGAVFIIFKMHCSTRKPFTVGTILTPASIRVHQTGRLGRLFLRRMRMAKMILLTLCLTAICNIPPAVFSFNFPAAFQDRPVDSLWPQFGEFVQYGFTPFILLIYNADYRYRLWKIIAAPNFSPDVIPATNSSGPRA